MGIVNNFSKRGQANHEISDWWRRLPDQQALEANQSDWMKYLRDTISDHGDEPASINDILKHNYFNPDTSDREWTEQAEKQFEQLEWNIEYFSIDELLSKKDKKAMAVEATEYMDDWNFTEEELQPEYPNGGKFFYPLDLPVILSEEPNDLPLCMKNGLYLYDGVHRLSAHALLNSQSVPAYVGRYQ